MGHKGHEPSIKNSVIKNELGEVLFLLLLFIGNRAINSNAATLHSTNSDQFV
jgi:hypothetical protein